MKQQHPYLRSRKDDLNAIESMEMMLMGGLVTDLDGASHEGAGRVPEKTAFDQASGAPNPDDDPGWKYGSNKSPQRWQNQMQQRGRTEDQITGAIQNGESYPTQNNVNPSNSATRLRKSNHRSIRCPR